MSQREGQKHKRQVPPKEFHAWHEESCPRLKTEPGLLCTGVDVWWMDCKNQTCLEMWEEAKA